MANGPTSRTVQHQMIRVFVSSTFRDMQAEREELTKRIFPQLRKLCEQRGVTWGEVDLRWGISDEQKAEGQVLPICLAEIERCRPYFIGLLGERYGWVPDEIPHELIQQEPWLARHRGCSVTELEILHGVLNNPERADHAFLYFRDPSYVGSLPEEEQVHFGEEPTAEEIERFGHEEAKRQAEGRKRKLAALKNRIRANALTVPENYHDPQELGRLVLRDLTEVIDRLYPDDEKPDPLDRVQVAITVTPEPSWGWERGGSALPVPSDVPRFRIAEDRRSTEKRSPTPLSPFLDRRAISTMFSDMFPLPASGRGTGG